MGPHPDTSAPATTPAGAEPVICYVCCAHCDHEPDYVHDSPCDDSFCTGSYVGMRMP